MMPRPHALVALVPLLLVPVAGAVEQADSDWSDEERDLTFQSDARSFHATSTRGSDLGRDELAVAFDLDSTTLSYRFTAVGDATTLAIDLGLDSLVEYRDADGDGALGPGDPVVRRLRLSDLDGTLSTQRVADGHRATVLYPVLAAGDGLDLDEPPAPGTLSVAFTVVPRPTNAGTPQSPLDVVVGVAVHDYPFQAPDTRIALQAGVAGNQRLLPGGLERPVELEAGLLRSFVAWDRTVTLDGAEVPVAATQLRSGPLGAGTVATLLWSYGRGDDVGHAMTVGTLRFLPTPGEIVQSIVEGQPLAFAGAVVVAVGLVGVPAARRLRRNA